jgi:hypothetical protein
MNQKGVIYIILSAILLYLYYRRRDIAIFAGFAVVVVGTLILGKGGEEGFGMGGGKKGGGGIDKECAKMGFKEVKIDKKDINGSLEKAMKNIEKVAETKWPFEKGDIEGKRTEDKTVEANWKVITNSTFLKDWLKGVSEAMSAKKEHKEYDAILGLWNTVEPLYKAFILEKSTDEEKTAAVNNNKTKLDKIITSGPIVIEFINKLKKSDEIKDADDGVKDILKYITCLVKQWISIFKSLKKAMSGDGEDDDEKPKKKPKKKKKSADDEEGGGGEDDDEKPKKKTKKKSADEGEDEDEKPKKKKKNKKKPVDDDDE